MQEKTQEELNKALASGTENNDIYAVEEALSGGADVNYRYGKHNLTPIIKSGWNKKLKMIQILLNAGADINIEDNDGDSFAKLMNGSLKLRIVYGKYLEESSAEMLTFRRKLGGRLLEEIYDFNNLERISLVRESIYEHVKRGGTTSESKVFPNTIIKSEQKFS